MKLSFNFYLIQVQRGKLLRFQFYQISSSLGKPKESFFKWPNPAPLELSGHIFRIFFLSGRATKKLICGFPKQVNSGP